MSVSETPPPSRSNVSPAKSSSTPLIAAVVVMLLLMGGLLVWKMSGSKEPKAVATVAPPPSAAPALPVLEEPPPPPPPIVEEADAGVKAVATGSKKSSGAATGGGGCSGECTGTEAGAFRAQLAGVARRAQGCYERALRQNDQLQGRMSVSLRVGPNGSVCSANIGTNQTGDPGLSSCVLQIFRSATFAAPKNGCVEAQVPLNFMPKQ